MQTMYPPQNNGPRTQLTAAINAAATSITVEDASILPPAPNILSLGGAENTELVKCVSITGNILTVERGFNGTTAKTWDAETYIYRGIQAQDVSALQANVTEVDGKADSHALRHARTGNDPLTPEDIGAMSEDATPTPASHAASHASSGADPTSFQWLKTLSADGWVNGSQDILIPVTSANTLFIGGVSDDDAEAISTAKMSVIHITGGIRFTAENAPSDDINLKISAV